MQSGRIGVDVHRNVTLFKQNILYQHRELNRKLDTYPLGNLMHCDKSNADTKSRD